MTFGSVFGRTFSPTFQPSSQAAAASGGGWWDLNGTITSCVAAYQPKGAASQSASYVNLVNASLYELTNDDGTTIPTWNTDTGWYFDGSNDRLHANNYSHVDTSFTVIVRATPIVNHNGTSALFSITRKTTSSTSSWSFKAEQYNNTGKVGLTSFGTVDNNSGITTPSTDSIIAITRNSTSINYYVGGSNSSATFTIYIDTSVTGFHVGMTKNGVITSDLAKGYIAALAYYHEELSSSQISSLSTAMAAL